MTFLSFEKIWIWSLSVAPEYDSSLASKKYREIGFSGKKTHLTPACQKSWQGLKRVRNEGIFNILLIYWNMSWCRRRLTVINDSIDINMIPCAFLSFIKFWTLYLMNTCNFLLFSNWKFQRGAERFFPSASQSVPSSRVGWFRPITEEQFPEFSSQWARWLVTNFLRGPMTHEVD